MSYKPSITVLSGGSSDERAVSLVSGKAVVDALKTFADAELIELGEDNQLPTTMDPNKTVIFPAFHGAFGEDGTLQRILEERGFAYAGSDAQASRLCMDKVATKERLSSIEGLSMAQHLYLTATEKPEVNAVIAQLGTSLVLKPQKSGSSVGLYLIETIEELTAALGKVSAGDWMIERRISGRELTIGLLEGKGMGIVEIIPASGVYDYHHKYTQGATQYDYPAKIETAVADNVRRYAELAFEQAGCRDFARIDFILTDTNEIYFLEINTIPGLTSTSLLPKSGSCVGLDFIALMQKMIEPALVRSGHKLRILD